MKTIGLAVLALTLLVPAAYTAKPRVIVLTDFYKDPDDKQSMVRFLSYANEFDIEGLIATALAWGTGEVHPEWIEDVIDAYGKVLCNLRNHDRDGYIYPSVPELQAVVKGGANIRRKWVGRGKGFPVPFPEGAKDSRACDPVLEWIGPGKDTDASNHIISVIDKNDPRPVWIVVWGGAIDLAQALWRVRNDRTAAQMDAFVQKIRVFQINWQDTGTVWIWENFPDLFMILSYQSMTGMYKEGEEEHRNQAWIDSNVKNHHGALGAQYPIAGNIDGIKEGDSPSFLHLLAAGLSDPEHPEWGAWGGRYSAYGRGTRFYVDAHDQKTASAGPMEEIRWTVGRWNKERNSDFAARMDWCVESYAEANHNPVAGFDGDVTKKIIKREAVAGSIISLQANGSSDPDGDDLSYRWWEYFEADTYGGTGPESCMITINNATSKKTSFRVPDHEDALGKEIHIILEVRDDGLPALRSYRRIIYTIRSVAGSKDITPDS